MKRVKFLMKWGAVFAVAALVVLVGYYVAEYYDMFRKIEINTK